MIWALIGALTAATTVSALFFVAMDAVAYRPLRRMAARGELETRPGTALKPFARNALGANPDLDHRYLVYEIGPGKVGVLRGHVAPAAQYMSVMLYDTLLQSVPPEESRGRTLLTDRELHTDAEGAFTALLVHDVERWRADTDLLDVSGVHHGVVLERHVGATPADLATFEVIDEAQARERWGHEPR